MRVAVLDTNVLAAGIAGLPKADSTPGEVLRRWLADDFQLIVSKPILMELADTLTDPYFIRRLTPAEIEDGLSRIRDGASLQPLTIQVHGIAAHPEDDLIIATAVSSQAPFLVTGDKALLRRGSYHETRILSPRQFLTVLDNDADG